MNSYALKVIFWEGPSGTMIGSCGWEIDRDAHIVTLAAHLEKVSETDVVPAAVQYIPVGNIHREILLAGVGEIA
jgi:hypothetical protein